MEKNRLFEIFNRVNKIKINEEVDNNYEFIDSFEETIKDEIEYKRGEFSEGIPQQITIQSSNYGDIVLNIKDQNPIEHQTSNNEELEYYVYYITNIQNNNIEITIPFVVNIEKNYDNNKIQFYNEIFPVVREIDVKINN